MSEIRSIPDIYGILILRDFEALSYLGLFGSSQPTLMKAFEESDGKARSSSANQVSQVSSVGKRLVFNMSCAMSDQMINLTKFVVALFALSTE